MKRSLVLGLAAIAAATVAGPVAAQIQAQHWPGRPPQPGPQRWQLLAFKTVGSATDSDVIRVNSNRTWTTLQLCSINAPIVMQDFTVHYRNGKREDVRVRNRINAGTCTRAIDLRGGQRHITQIRLKYSRIQRGMRTPLIRVMAR